ncbi:MAG: cobyrinate a,c-diamide synthase [Alphaproteobacteria bacterium]|nr:cobyrinate a,c-diamide synthase [Alphaproteobacteria bacterium]
MVKGLVIAAPHSGSGKTLFTLGLLRALRNQGRHVASAKAGPDYIDPGFHAAATGKPCINLDLWAMGEAMAGALAGAQAASADILIIEGVMGLFDGPQGAKGSTADLAAALGLPILLVVDTARQGQSIAALVQGFRDFRPDVRLAGVILNRVASDKHEAILHGALSGIGATVLGALRQFDSLSLPSRHLGLVQAQENQQLEAFIESAASGVARETFLDRIFESAAPLANHPQHGAFPLPPLAQSIAVARDDAFSFAYPHLLQGWQRQGAELRFFSPLADEAPPKADAVFLPGGYPELHAGKLAANGRFLNGLKAFQGLIYGECGGYMVLGEGLIDASGARHAMAGLLPLATSFASRKLHLGYRQLQPLAGPWQQALRGHEFHYSTIARQGGGEPLFRASDATAADLGHMGQRIGNVMGSYAHVISVAA